MLANKRGTLIINLLGGAAVLGSYAWGFATRPDAAAALWGGVPEALRPFYTAGMLLAASGYFLFSYFILFRLPARQTRVAGRWGYGAFDLLYAAMLIPSALWMPLTLAAISAASIMLVWVVRLVLAMVAVASLGLLAALSRVQPRTPAWSHALALAGCTLFCLQTVLLDGVIWSALFHL